MVAVDTPTESKNCAIVLPTLCLWQAGRPAGRRVVSFSLESKNRHSPVAGPAGRPQLGRKYNKSSFFPGAAGRISRG